jgi:hypothetical protein
MTKRTKKVGVTYVTRDPPRWKLLNTSLLTLIAAVNMVPGEFRNLAPDYCLVRNLSAILEQRNARYSIIIGFPSSELSAGNFSSVKRWRN